MTEPLISYFRIRVVNTSPLFYFSDGFENTSGMTVTPASGNTTGTLFWHSLGTEAGTDNSINYWTVVTGSPSYSAHLITPGANATSDPSLVAGHDDWGDATFTIRFKMDTGGAAKVFFHHVDTNNWIELRQQGGVLALDKRVGGVTTASIVTATSTLSNATFYWAQISGSGTTYTCTIYNDSAGAIGSQVSTVSGTISDAGVQTGKIGISGQTANFQFGGAFANVCTVTGTGPDGTQGQIWTPVVTTGEPAFAWSKNAPQAGTFSGSIQIRGSASGNGAWQQTIRLFSGSNVTLSAQAKASAGTANVSAGGLTTGNAGTAFGAVTATGAITANPTVSCNYSGAVGTAYFDSLSITNPAFEITNDLPHLHQTHIDVVAMQPGNPGSTALGSWSCQLFPPGTEQYAAAKPIYDKLDYVQRLEFYISPDGQSLGKLYYAGVVTGIRKGYGQNPVFELSGVSDLFWLNYSRPFPGEVLSTNYNSGSTFLADYRQAHNYFGTHESGASDNFSPFTASNYTSSNLPTLTAGTWTASADDGLNVITCSTGTGAALISKTGAAGQDKRFINFVEVTGRLGTGTGGRFGIGLSQSNANCNNATVAYVTINGTGLDVTKTDYSGGTQAASQTVTSALTVTADPDGFISITISLSVSGATGGTNGTAVTANGKLIMNTQTSPAVPTSYDASLGTNYPFVFYGTNGGTSPGYYGSLVQEIRYTDDQNPGTAMFKAGTIGTPAFSLQNGIDPGPTFLEVISRVAAREGWYWRYTPQPYIVGTRTIGTIDMTTDPGTDRGTNKSVVFSRADGNLVDLQLSANADQIAAGTIAASVSTTDGGGAAPWRDVSTLSKYGAIDDQVLVVTAPNFTEQRRAARNVIANRIALGTAGSKTAIVHRDPQTADVWRELDKVMIHDPELGINYLVARAIGYTFDEGQPSQTLTLDQFSVDDPTLPAKRFQQGVFQTTLKFGNR